MWIAQQLVRALTYQVLGSIPGKAFFPLSLFHHPLFFPPPFSFLLSLRHGNAMTFDPKHCRYYTDFLANLNSHQLRVASLAALTQHDGEH